MRHVAPTRFRLAVLLDVNDKEAPSSLATLRSFSEMARRRKASIILGDHEALSNFDYDALFIRQSTGINNPAHNMSHAAAIRKIPVLNDFKSIAVCSNKLVMMTRFAQANVPTPIGRVIRMEKPAYPAFEMIKEQLKEFGYPVVLKDPATSFSRGVFKADNDTELWYTLNKINETCEDGLIQAQEFIPTRFDWHIGVLGGKVLFCCQYTVAKGYWQEIKHSDDGTYEQGGCITLPPELWPDDICALAIKAAACAGTGLYGVDIKESKKGFVVVGVTDSPRIEIEQEDKFGNVWERIIEHFRRLVEKSKPEREHVQDYWRDYRI